MRVSDVAAANPKVRGLVLIGFHGHSLKEMVDFQAYRRPVELFVKPDVDADHDGYITRDEAAKWGKDFAWPWKEGETRVSLADYSESLRTNPDYLKAIDQLAKAPTYKGIWDREPMFDLVARFTIPVLAFTGTADVFTPPSELESLQAACTRAGKQDCETHLVPGLGHFMSAPRPPRGQPLVDMTNGPVDKDFLDLLTRTLSAWREQVHP
jgi:pimeloyl-ACP methyl ester carboxylesterase